MNSLIIDQSTDSIRVFINGNLKLVLSQELYNDMERMGLFPENYEHMVKFLKAKALIPLGDYKANWIKEVDTSVMADDLKQIVGDKIFFDNMGKRLYKKRVLEE